MREGKIVAYAKVSFDGEGGVVADRMYNCTVENAGAGVGDFNLTIGQGGVDRTLCQIVLIPSGVDLRAGSTIHTSDIVKRIQFRDATGTLAAPTQAWVEIRRMSPQGVT